MYTILKFLLYLPIRLIYRVKFVKKVELPKKDKRLVIICNHLSNLDVVILGILLPYKIKFVAKKELFKNVFLRKFFNCLGCISVDRDNPSSDSLKQMIKVLKNDKQLGIFPEGKRNKTNEILLPFKSGFEKFALKTNSKVLVMTIVEKPKIFRRTYVYASKIIECKQNEDNITEIRNEMEKIIKENRKNNGKF